MSTRTSARWGVTQEANLFALHEALAQSNGSNPERPSRWSDWIVLVRDGSCAFFDVPFTHFGVGFGDI